jgi:hypothetical protein
MSAAPAPSSLNRALRRRPTARSKRPAPRVAWSYEGPHRVEIVAPDPECAALLLEYALASAPPSCASLLYGGRNYLIRSSAQLRETIILAGDALRAGLDA